MDGRLRDRLAQRAADSFVGRADELARLLDALGEDGPSVVYVHGIAGMGKTSLLDAFSSRARDRGVTVVRLDSRAIEPTERGFLHELGSAIGGDTSSPDAAADRLRQVGDRVVLSLDTYELLRLLDTWLRDEFLPLVPDTVRVTLFSRERPVPAWHTTPGWQGIFASIELQPLGEQDALTLLASAGLAEEEARQINRFAHGHPLALTLAAARGSRGDFDPELGASQRVVEELTRLYLADVEDALTRQSLDAVSVVRRGTLSVLGAMLPEAAPRDAFDRLTALPFVEIGRDGLLIHDAVQQAIAATLRATDPSRYREYRQAAWRQLRDEVRNARGPDLWRYTADLLYIIENPNIREAFFPSHAHHLTVAPSRPDDGSAILEMTGRHDGAEAAVALEAWWRWLPRAFSSIRDLSGQMVGFYCMADTAEIGPEIAREDPIADVWMRHLRRVPVPDGQRTLAFRRWLSVDVGEQPSPSQAASWLDAKRAYMELRPALRRVYTTARDVPTYGPTIRRLGFQVVDEATVEIDGLTYVTGMLDFGPGSVEGWLSRLIATELDVQVEAELLDAETRELVVDGRRVGLTRLEFSVMQYLYQRAGKPVTRAALLQDVWGYDYDGGSNVVDVVVRALRKKLGHAASAIETVTGVGYRLRR